ncbi:NusA N-terminal domain-containing protein, partial [Peribacillus sp. NPDC060186]
MGNELLDALYILENEKGISREVLIDAIEAALISAYRRNFNQAQNVRIDLNLGKGTMRVFARKDVVDEVFDSRLEISVEEARAIDPNYQLEDIVEMEVTPKDFGRIAAQTAKQVVTQRVREA